MERLLVAAVLTVGAIGVATLLQQTRRPTSITAPGPHGARLPQALDRADFPTTAAPWLVAVFSSATCHTCAGVVAAARELASADVGVVDVEWGAERELHRRYGIDAVPAVAFADADGNVLRWVLGPVTVTELRGAFAGLDPNAAAAPSERPVDVRPRVDRPASENDSNTD